MKLHNLYILILLNSMLLSSAYSQGITEAVRYSSGFNSPTARVLGVGGAFGAMGGDISSLNINPAGIGDYNKGEFVFGTSINNVSSDAFIVGLESDNQKKNSSRFLVDNLGFVFAKRPNSSSWLTSNFAIGYLKTASFNEDFYYEGINQTSILSQFQEQAFDGNFSEFGNQLAVETGAIYEINGDNYYHTDIEGRNLPIFKSQNVERRGSSGELAFGWAGNYRNNVNFGLSLGIPILSFEETKIYEENNDAIDIANQFEFSDLSYIEKLETSGVGFNIKLGAVVKAGSNLRFGVAFHSPTWYSLNDDYYATFDYSYYDSGNLINDDPAKSPDGHFKYSLSTPWKAIGSVGYLFNFGSLKGFANVDFEYLDYRNNHIGYIDDSENPDDLYNELLVNNQIDDQLDKVLNVRMGTELVIADFYRARLGYEILPSPFYDDVNNSAFSAGLGYRGDGFYIDLGLRFGSKSSGYLPYTFKNSDDDLLVNVDQNQTKGNLTVGFKF